MVGNRFLIFFTNGVIIQWGVYIATSEYSQITLPISYSVNYIPITAVLSANLKNGLFDAHLPCIFDNANTSFIGRYTYVNEYFRWVTIGV